MTTKTKMVLSIAPKLPKPQFPCCIPECGRESYSLFRKQWFCQCCFIAYLRGYRELTVKDSGLLDGLIRAKANRKKIS